MGNNTNLVKNDDLIAATISPNLRQRNFETLIKVAHLFMLVEPTSAYKPHTKIQHSRLKGT